MSLSAGARPRLLEPGLPRLDPGLERYRVRGGGSAVIALAAGDRITITDVEGRQRAELLVFSPEGREDAAALGLKADGPAEGLKAGGAGAAALEGRLKARGIHLETARAVHLFGLESRAGDEVNLAVERDAVCVVAALGGPMRVDEQDPPTDLSVVVKRAKVEPS
ncbi:MAG: aminomethyltransferase, partial [Alphaproteobacteria bacterium]